MATTLEHQALLECILQELKLKGLNFAKPVTPGVTPQVTPRVFSPAAGPAGHRDLLTPETETWSETPSPSAASTETWWTQSTSASVESSPLLQPKQLCLDAETRLSNKKGRNDEALLAERNILELLARRAAEFRSEDLLFQNL